MQAKCIIEFCTKATTTTSRIDCFNKLCRQHQVDAAESLMLRMPKSLATTRQAFVRTNKGSTWFADWVRLIEATYRSRFWPGHPFEIKDLAGNYRPVTADPARVLMFEKTVAIPTPKYEDQSTRHPGSQDPTLKRKK